MSARIPETLAAKEALSDKNDVPNEEQQVQTAPSGSGENNEIEEIQIDPISANIENVEFPVETYADVASTNKTIDLYLAREDNANDYHVNYKEVADLVFKRLGVPSGMLKSVDTTPYKKIILELDGQVDIAMLNITQALQIRKGLWTKPLQSPEKDRPVFIKWAPMKMLNKDIEAVIGHFGEITRHVSHVVIMNTGEDWAAAMEGVRTAERDCRMKIRYNIPSLIMVRGVKIMVHYPGQPKTCTHCLQWWHYCPGGGKVDKCKKNGGKEGNLKANFKKIVNGIKIKERRGGDEVSPIVPQAIPDPDQVKFSGLPEDWNLTTFKAWLDEKGVCFTEPMVFKGTKPGTFLINSIILEDGEKLILDADDASETVTKLNGAEVEHKHQKKRVIVQMGAMTTPEKKKMMEPKEVVDITDSSRDESNLGASGSGEAEKEKGKTKKTPPAAPASAKPSEVTGDKEEEEEREEVDEEVDGSGGEGDEEGDEDSLKLMIKTQTSKTGTKTTRVVGGKAKRADLSASSLDASPPLQQKKRVKGKRNGKGKK